MRKFYLFWILMVSGFVNLAQNLNIARHSNVDGVSSLVTINSKSFYLEKVEEGTVYGLLGNWVYSPDSAQLVGVDHLGNTIFKKRFSHGSTSRITVLKPTLDKALVYIGFSWPCDVTSLSNYLVKMDTNGAELFSTYLSVIPIGWGRNPTDFTQHLDSSFYLVADSLMYHVSKTGQYLSKTNTGLIGIKTIDCLANGNFLVNTSVNNVNKLVELSTQNVIINQQTILEPIQKIKIASNGTIYGLTNSQNIRTYQSNLSALNCSSVTLGPQISINAMDCRNDTLFVAGLNTNSNELYYGVLSQSLQALYQTQANYKFISPKGISVNSKNRVSVISNCTSSTYTNNSFSSLYNFPILGNFQSKYDVGVSNISLTGYTISSNFVNWTFNVTVKNYGNDTIKGFKLNRYVGQSLCNHMGYNKYYSTLILPHDSLMVSTYPLTQVLPWLATSTTAIGVCFFTSIPNSSNDVETLNDDYCTSFFLPVGIGENAGSEKILQIFPNPFSSQIQIQSDVEMKEIELFNSLGMSLKKIALNKKAAEIYTNDLPKGVYFLRIETGKGFLTKKLIKGE